MKKQRWEESEKRREEKTTKKKKKSEKRKSQRKKMQVREKVAKSDSPCFSNDLWLRRVEK